MKKIELRIILSVCLVFLYTTHTNSQQYKILNFFKPPLNYSSKDFKRLNQRVFDLFKKSKCSENMEEITIFYIFDFSNFYFVDKKDFLDGTIYKKIRYGTYKVNIGGKIKEFISPMVLIGDKNKRLIGKGSALIFLCQSDFDPSFLRDEQFLIDHMEKLEIEYFFTLSFVTRYPVFFGVTRQHKFYVFEANEKEIQVMLLEDFFESGWDKYFNYKIN